MSDAIDLKKQVMSLKHSKENVYDGVEVWADDETVIGSAPSGTLLTNPYIVYFPWNGSGTQGQTIAENIWDGLSGYNYNPYEASGAIIDPAAQLGDIVKIDGMRSVIASKSPFMDSLFATDIGAPEENEEDTEYQIETVTSRLKNAIRRANGAYASLKVNVDDIIAEVTDGNGNFTALVMDANGIVITGKDGAVSVKGSQIQAGSLVLTDNITFNGVASNAANAQTIAQQIVAGTYTGGTFIDGQTIHSPTLSGQNLLLNIGADYPTTHVVGALTVRTNLGTNYDIFKITTPSSGYPIALIQGAAGCQWDLSTAFLQRMIFEDEAAFNADTYLNSAIILSEGDNYGTQTQRDNLNPVEGQLFFLLS